MTVASALWAVFKSPFRLLAFIIGKVGWFKFITIILIGTVFITSAIESYNQRSPLPFIKQVGGKLIEADGNLYQGTTNAVQQGIEAEQQGMPIEPLDRLKLLFPLIVNVWFIFVNIKIIYWILRHTGIIHNETPLFPQKLFTVFVSVWVLQILYTLVFLEWTSGLGTLYKLIPFRGVIVFILNIPYFFNFLEPFVLENQGKTLGQVIMGWLGR